ncbi:thioredoxin family protein [Candidatus Pelagibacter sp.]|jgi:thioredoxin 1|nr:thioredoxin family protein [Candidatus Pelagibacter sp.]|tara:strand:- start:1264 stop:1584 length:321 start_codon:yes stop_codon:yes gene_type:complete
MLIDFKDEDFETKIKQEDVSVVQFSAAWCGPCKSLRPIMENLSETNKKENQNYYYADVEEGAINTASAAGIRGVPTVIIYKKGIEVNRLVGGVPEGKMKEFLAENI